MARKRSNSKIRSLIVRLREEEKWSFKRIGDLIKMTNRGVSKIYKNEKMPIVYKKDGRPRCTASRLDTRIAKMSKENPFITAPDIKRKLKLENVSTSTIQRRLREVGHLDGRHPPKKTSSRPKPTKANPEFPQEKNDSHSTKNATEEAP